MPNKIMIIAGEASGDLHGAELVASILKKNPDAEIFGVGGDRMRRAGVELYYHVDQLAYIGFWEVIKHYGFFRRVFYDLVEKYQSRKPDLVVLIDYPGFNLRFAKKIHQLGGKVFYYIAPQVWAWHQSRAKKMAIFIDHLAVIFDFEKTFFDKYGLKTSFVGHPLLEGLKNDQSKPDFCTQYGIDETKPVLGLFPGSRNQEVENLLPVMAATAMQLKAKHPELTIAVSKAETISRERLLAHIDDPDAVHIIEHNAYALMDHADAAIVASGTATLETACFATPFAIAYKVSPMSYEIGKRVVKIPYIGLANIVAGEQVAKEFIQHELTPENLAPEVESLLFDKIYRLSCVVKLNKVRGKLGEPGASDNAAELVLDMLNPKSV